MLLLYEIMQSPGDFTCFFYCDRSKYLIDETAEYTTDLCIIHIASLLLVRRSECGLNC